MRLGHVPQAPVLISAENSDTEQGPTIKFNHEQVNSLIFNGSQEVDNDFDVVEHMIEVSGMNSTGLDDCIDDCIVCDNDISNISGNQ
jgi:hypothetical protein